MRISDWSSDVCSSDLAEGGAFLVHVDEDLADRAVFVFAGAQVDLVAADDGLLGVALAPLRQAPAPLGPLDDALDDALGDDLRALRLARRGDPLGQALLRLFVVGDAVEDAGGARLGKLGAAAVERIGSRPEERRGGEKGV